MKRIIALLTTVVLILLLSVVPISAVTDVELINALLPEISGSVSPEKIQISSKLELDEKLTVFSYRITGDFAYPAFSQSERVGDYLYTFSPETMLYLYDRGKVTDLFNAYAEESITKDQINMIAEAYPSKALSVFEYTDGFCVSFMFEEKYKKTCNDQCIRYRELYHHKNVKGETDWVLACNLNRLRGLGVNNDAMKYDDRIISYYSEDLAKGTSPFAVYDVARSDFIDLAAIIDNNEEYDGLIGILNSLSISRPMGDADYDGALTILDATFIQRVIAELIDDNSINPLVADYDNDGEVTILDATAIQRKLAHLD